MALVAVFALTACGGDDDDVASSEDAACEALGQLAQSYQALLSLDPATASVDDLESAVGDIESAREDVASAAEGLADAQLDNLQSAVDDLRSAVDDNSDMSIPDMMGAIQPQIDAVETARADIDGTLVCTVGSDEG